LSVQLLTEAELLKFEPTISLGNFVGGFDGRLCGIQTIQRVVNSVAKYCFSQYVTKSKISLTALEAIKEKI
jgi:hypothetical protein